LTNANTEAALPYPNCIVIYTDGSCQPNPGPGGFAAILYRLINGEVVVPMEQTGGAVATTNNQMELGAAIAALKQIKRDEPLPIFVRSDSKYLVDGWNQWLPRWIAKGWRKGDGKPVENPGLWREIIRLCDGLNVTFEWVRGHAGDPMNEEADRLASEERDKWVRKHAQELFGSAA